MMVSRQAGRYVSAIAACATGAGLFAATIRVEAQSPAAGQCGISGTVVGVGTPLPGVSITARRGDTVQSATSTGLDGTYRLSVPPAPAGTTETDAAYRLTIDLTGFDRIERLVTVNSASCDQTLDVTLTLLPRGTVAATPAGRARGAGPGATAGTPSTGPNARPPAPGRFETLEVTENEASTGIDTGLFEAGSPAADALLPPGFGSEALSDAIAITGDAARVDRGVLNERGAAIRRGDFTLDSDAFPPDGGIGGNAPAQVGGGGRGGRGNNFVLGGRGGRQNRIQAQVNYGFSGSALNAAPRQLRSEVAGTERPFSNHNVSTTVGGPLKIPGLYNNATNSTNFTLTFSGTRGGNLFDQYATVPTDAMRAGDFSSSSGTLIDPATGTPFPDNQIPGDRVSPQARALLDYYPAPNLSGNTRNYHYSTSTASTSNQIQLRIQHNFSGQAAGGRGGGGAPRSNAGQAGRGQRLLAPQTNVNMNASVQYQGQRSDQLNVFTTLGGERESTSLGVPVTFTVRRGRTQHQFGVTYNHTSSETRNRFSGVSDVSNLIGIEGVSDDPFAWGLPRLSFSSISGLSDVTPSRQVADRFSTQYTWSRPLGRRHSLRAGGDFRYDVTSTNTESNANGAFVFTGLYSSGGGQLGGLTGFDFADFLLGMPQQATIQYGPGETTLTGRTLGLFIQDDWRARPNLTFQLGVRYDLLWPYVEENGQLVNLDVTPDFTAAAPVVAGDYGAFSGAFPAALIQTDTNNVSPKLGVAWRGPSRTVFNGSYEVNYNSGTYSGIARQLAQQPPFATTGTNIGSLSTALLMESALTGISASDTRNNYGIDKDYVLGLVQQTVLNVRRDLGRTWQGSVTYTHTRGSNLEIVRAPNRDADGLRIEGVQPFTWTTAEGRSILNSATFGLQKRQTGGVGYGVEYTLAKSRDNSPSIGGGGGGGGSNVAQNDQDIDAEWGLSNFDQRHRLTLRLQAELPFGDGKRWLANGGFFATILDDWRFTANFSADSGRPRTVTVRGASRDIATGVNGALRADYNGMPLTVDDPTIDRYFNTDAFSIPTAGLFGSSPRNVIVGPGSKNLNGGVSRDVRLGGNRVVSIQMNVNNLLNLANYTGIDTNVNSPTFGQITGISGARSARLNLRFRF
jgi:hypothetical protein